MNNRQIVRRAIELGWLDFVEGRRVNNLCYAEMIKNQAVTDKIINRLSEVE